MPLCHVTAPCTLPLRPGATQDVAPGVRLLPQAAAEALQRRGYGRILAKRGERLEALEAMRRARDWRPGNSP